ncbi:hypothetical protein MKX03_025108 [Papaver bracteatum]|nr:hypothetical protein MKX03_025108 [Papaver bracteatum]
MAWCTFKRFALLFLLLSSLFSLDQANRDELGEIIGSSKINISGFRPRQCKEIGSCWCCIYIENPKRCVKEKNVCVANCQEPQKRA